MRIIIVLREFYSPSKPIGGAERQALKLANAFIDRGLSVKVVAGKWDWGQPSQDQIGDIPVDRHFTAWGLFDIRGLRRLGPYIYLCSLLYYLFSHRDEFDLIHCHSALFGAPVVAFSGKKFGKKTIIRSMASGNWGDVQRMQGSGAIWGAGWLQRNSIDADRYVALNPQVAEELRRIGVSAQKITHIPNGVECAPQNPKRDYESINQFSILFVGRLHPQKGVDFLLKAFRKVVETEPTVDWLLNLVGSGYLSNPLQELAKELAVDKFVRFTGEVDDPRSLYLSSDLFVLPSRSEGLSNALLEAMSYGLPCIASDIPGNNDLIEDGINGSLVAMDDINGMARTILALAGNANQRNKLGGAAYRSVVEKYSINYVAGRYMDLYQELLSA